MAAILASAAALRVPVIGWGLPPTIPHVLSSDLRCSYAFDEDDILTPISFGNPAQLDFDPRNYVWGTLHFHILLAGLEAAEQLGLTGGPWRQAYYNLTPGAFDRVYVAGRSISLLFGLLSIWLVYRLGCAIGCPQAGLWGAAVMAFSPAHLLASVQIRADLTMVCLLLLAALVGLRVIRQPRYATLLLLGLVSGMACTAKYSAVLPAAGIVLAALAAAGFHPRNLLLVAAGAVAGGVLGEPYALVRWHEVTDQLAKVFLANSQIPAALRPSIVVLLLTQFSYAARFAAGPAASVASLAGFYILVRRHAPSGRLIAAAAAGAIIVWVPLVWPMLRYQLPLLPFLALAAGIAIHQCPAPLRWALGCAALLFPLAGSIDQFLMMRSEHPGNQALTAILETVPAGSVISRLTVEMPPLDRKVYPKGPNPFLDDLRLSRPAYVVTSNLPDKEYPETNLQLLKGEYGILGEFALRRRFPWATLGEAGSPHDWKYTHPRLVLYRRHTR